MTADPISSAQLGQSDPHDDTSDDNWYEDSLDDGFGSSELNREWEKRHDQFHKMGYRDGIIAGKEASAQEGFNIGFKQSVLVGYNWGLVRGVTSALAGLPDHLKDKLAATLESKNRFVKLHESVQSISKDDALKMYHNGIPTSGLEQPQSHSEGKVRVGGNAVDEESGCGQLADYFQELKLLLRESPEIEAHSYVWRERETDNLAMS